MPPDPVVGHEMETGKDRWHVEITPRSAALDSHGRAVLADVRQLGLPHVEAVRSSRVYLFGGDLHQPDVQLVADELLLDPVAETCVVRRGLVTRDGEGTSIEVHPLPGVMNPAALSTLEAARQLLRVKGRIGARLETVQTARRYAIGGARSAGDLECIAGKVLANDCIETWYIRGFTRNDAIPEDFPRPPQREFAVRRVNISAMSDAELTSLSREAHLFLSLEEMRVIRDHYAAAKREPTDLELETLAQTWSEHCVHKTLKSQIEYRGAGFPCEQKASTGGRAASGTRRAVAGATDNGQVEVRFENLLKETIVAATKQLNRDWCLSVFVDNAGVIAFDEEYGIAFKVETHNHPSAIEPYGGSATGVGGCIRDVMGCGLGAKPIASTDVFCLAPPNFDEGRVPAGVLHPRRVLKGVVSGVRDYGNRMGIPTVNGAIYFDERYLANPLVFCGCVGLIPRNRIAKQARSGDFIIVAGGRTGRDGIHGATFSSAELTDQHADEFSHAVQIGNAIEEKKLLDAQLIARDHPDGCLYSAVTDCGAGGLSSAVGEMGADLGALVDLEKVPLKYAGLRYDEIWISEAQERMVFAVPPEKLDRFLAVFGNEEVEATIIGRFTNDRTLRVRYEGVIVGELDMEFLHEGLPKPRRKATWAGPPERASSNLKTGNGASHPAVPCRRSAAAEADQGGSVAAADRPADLYALLRQRARSIAGTDGVSSEALLTALRNLNVASKEWVIRQYDHEVQGRSVIKPLVGPKFGPSDAAVLRPRYDSHRGIALACGLCPHISDFDPYMMAILALDEALRNVICVGADLAHTAILDNFCWPKVDNEESMGALVRACVGARDAAVAYGLPFISGKDSLNNQFSMSAEEAKRTGLPQQIAIPPTLLISALGIVPDVRRCVTMDLKEPGNVLVLMTADVGICHFETAKNLHDRVSSFIRGGKVRAAHDISEGGLAVAVAEMCIASGTGADVEISEKAELAFETLFRESSTSYVLEMREAEAHGAGQIIGRVTAASGEAARLRIGETVDVSVDELARAWRQPLAEGGAAH